MGPWPDPAGLFLCSHEVVKKNKKKWQKKKKMMNGLKKLMITAVKERKTDKKTTREMKRDVVALRVKPQKPLCCKVRRPAVVRLNPCNGLSSRCLSQLLPT